METMTTESKHTPGPWIINNQDTELIRIQRSDDGISIATIHSMLDGIHNEERLQEQVANARLIASAPETAAERDRLKEINKELVEIVQKVAAYQKSVEAGFQGIAKDHYLELRTMIESYFAKAKGQ